MFPIHRNGFMNSGSDAVSSVLMQPIEEVSVRHRLRIFAAGILVKVIGQLEHQRRAIVRVLADENDVVWFIMFGTTSIRQCCCGLPSTDRNMNV